MTENMIKSVNLAMKISVRAEEALSDLEREMDLKNWPQEFRGIMWDAVADLAAIRGRKCWGKK